MPIEQLAEEQLAEALQKPHVDPTALEALQEVMEDEYPLLLDTFLSDSQLRLNELHRSHDLVELGHAAHSFKGSSSNMGALRLAQLCSELEQYCRQGALEGVDAYVQRIDREFVLVLQLYSQERARFAG
ncbi:hypothetical protein AHFPHNDE_02646 [Pseudomonas sp. MM227]|nr:hypothetical protein AHFPHNDE_02646 [Pseudomonas sp. MM227]